jgi:ATP-dependent DNA helicase HFM1/MER3
VGLSATLPNLGDIGEWLDCTAAGIHYFDDSYRPIPLQAITLVCGNMGNPFLFDRSLDNRVKDVIARYSDGKQTLIFCSSKNNAQNLAMKLRDQSAARIGQSVHTSNLLAQLNNPEVSRVVNAIQDETLKGLVMQGYGYHHAGLPPDDRAILEELFLKGYIRILCSTSTLAHGVNLPAHLVIIKGTYSWRGSSKGYEKMGRSDVIQMLGRAGRPGFDQHGVAVIMTSNEDRQYYSNLSLSADLVESKLISILPEGMFPFVHLTNEFALLTFVLYI